MMLRDELNRPTEGKLSHKLAAAKRTALVFARSNKKWLIGLVVLCIGGGSVLAAQQNATHNNSSDVSGTDIKTPASDATEAQSESQATGNSSNGSTSNSSSTNVTVNGQTIDTPANGSVHQVINDDGSTTTIDGTYSSGGSHNTSTTHITTNGNNSNTNITIKNNSSSSSSSSSEASDPHNNLDERLAAHGL